MILSLDADFLACARGAAARPRMSRRDDGRALRRRDEPPLRRGIRDAPTGARADHRRALRAPEILSRAPSRRRSASPGDLSARTRSRKPWQRTCALTEERASSSPAITSRPPFTRSARDERSPRQLRPDRRFRRSGRGGPGRPGRVAPEGSSPRCSPGESAETRSSPLPPTSASRRRSRRSPGGSTSRSRTAPTTPSTASGTFRRRTSWSDTRAFDGTATIVQPLIAPLYGGKSAHGVLAALSEQPERSGYAPTRPRHVERQAPGRGGVAARAPRRRRGGDRASSPRDRGRGVPFENGGWSIQSGAGASLEITFRTDPTIHDGRFANNGWLQELPKPMTR